MNGLTTSQAEDKLLRGYGNTQVDNTQKTTKDILKENIFTYFNFIFFILAILLIIAGSFNSLTFLPVIIANTLIGIVQELKAKKILDNLSVLNEQNAQVIRDGEEQTIPVGRLVMDDIIVLRSGNQIPADAVVVSGEVNVNEALLTGESDEIVKKENDELMSGSFVVSGICYAKLIRVGEKSYISQLTLKAKKMPKGEQSEMIKSINRIVLAFGIAIIPIGGILIYQGFASGSDFSDNITTSVAAVIGMIPEGMYLLVSIALAMSAARLAMNNVMLHDMKSTETLARVDVLCVDKTGTITDNSMLVCDVISASTYDEDFSNDEDSEYTNEISASDANLIRNYIASLPDNNLTMKAIEDYFGKENTKSALENMPFTSKLKFSAVRFDDATYVLGAPEILFGQDYETYKDFVNRYASKGLRVLVFAKYINGVRGEHIEVLKEGIGDGHIEPIMYILLQNPIRENAKETFAYFDKQGVNVKVISGDNPITVSEVAKRAGIKSADKYIDASALSNDELSKAALKYTVFGRVQPEQKRIIVKAIKKSGKKVAMTGDGVNDILAMKDADCSIAMAAGSDAAVQAAQVVLLDSDFSHMKEIVAEGRKDINNITRSATLFLVKNIFSLLLSVFSIINVMTYPLMASQVTFISMFNIGIPAFFFALEGNTKKSKGRFLVNVILKAMPAALTDFFAIAALVVFGETFGVSSEDISVASTFVLVIVGFMILVRISSPMNKFRFRVVVGCIIGMIFTAIVFSDLFSISYISKECVMLFVLFVIATEPCMRYLTFAFEKLDFFIHNKILKNK